MITRIEKFYKGIPRRDKTPFIKEVARICGYSVNGVKNWFLGYSKPYENKVCKILSEKTGIPEKELFTWVEEEE